MVSFNVRIEDETFLKTFDQLAEDQGFKREPMVRKLMEDFVARQGEEEVYYTIRGYSDDHKKYAQIRNMDGLVNWHSDGIEYNSHEWRVLEHAVDLAERGESGDKEEVIKLLQSIFGERNVFIKEDD